MSGVHTNSQRNNKIFILAGVCIVATLIVYSFFSSYLNPTPFLPLLPYLSEQFLFNIYVALSVIFIAFSAVFYNKLGSEDFVKYQPRLWIYPVLLFTYLLLVAMLKVQVRAEWNPAMLSFLLFYLGSAIYLGWFIVIRMVTEMPGGHLTTFLILIFSPFFLPLLFIVFLIKNVLIWRSGGGLGTVYKQFEGLEPEKEGKWTIEGVKSEAPKQEKEDGKAPDWREILEEEQKEVNKE